MSAYEAISLATSLGVFSGGLGLLKWGLSCERRLFKLEVKTGIQS